VDVDNSHVSSGSVPRGGIKKEIPQDIIFLPAEEWGYVQWMEDHHLVRGNKSNQSVIVEEMGGSTSAVDGSQHSTVNTSCHVQSASGNDQRLPSSISTNRLVNVHPNLPSWSYYHHIQKMFLLRIAAAVSDLGYILWGYV
jgi:hypothetical protein